MVFAHSLIGVPVTYLISKNYLDKLSLSKVNLVFFIGVIGAVFPDFDLLLSFFIEDLNHRALITHSVFIYLVLWFILYLVFKKIGNKFLNLCLAVFFVNVLIHLFLDYLVGGISLFSPFVVGIYGNVLYFGDSSSFFDNYFRSWYMLTEILALFFSLFFIIKLKKYQVNLVVPFIFLLTAFIMAISF